MKLPRNFFKPLAIGAPAPRPRASGAPRARRSTSCRRIVDKMRGKIAELITQVDVVLGNLEDAVPAHAKLAARAGFIEIAKAHGLPARPGCGRASTRSTRRGRSTTWSRSWPRSATSSIMVMLPKVEGPWDIHYPRSAARPASRRNVTANQAGVLIHAILETAEGVDNVAAIATASPRMHGISLGPADLAASRAMKTTRVGGGHPDYVVLADAAGDAPRAKIQQDLWHYTTARMVDACAAAGIKPFYGPFGDFSDPAACEAQFRNAFLMGCAGAWSLHPSQVAIAKRVFSPDPAEVAFAQKILTAMPDGTGAVMIDGKMQDDATWKQAKVVVDLARLVAAKDPEMASHYGL